MPRTVIPAKPNAFRPAWQALLGPLLAALALAAPALHGDPRRADPVSVPRFTHPGAGQVVYFVLTDRFANGSTANDSGGIPGGPEASGFDPTKINHFHGGDLAGLTSKLDYIKGLGVTAIWITPPFRNQVLIKGSAGYHGYWILDFTRIDPHLGTELEFRSFVDQAHARGLKVYLDIVINHTGDVIKNADGSDVYRSLAEAPYRDASGRPFDPRTVAYNGVNAAEAFPALSAEASFPHRPALAKEDAHAKAPDWLNDVTVYHNRGSSTFKGESSTFGDFGGLDDLFTEDPRVVKGFIDVYSGWIERFGIDGYRIDTVRHVNMEFWQAFLPAVRERAAAAGRPDFLMFGEVANMDKNVELMSAFTTTGTLDAALDFGFYVGARDFVSKGRGAGDLYSLFSEDDLYTGHDVNAQSATTFISNHDDGRFGYFLKLDNPGSSPERLAALDLLGQELLLTVRGQPIVYYGDEQGMSGSGNDNSSRQDMFPSKAPQFAQEKLLGTTRTGADDKFDEGHPFYRAIRALSDLREGSPGLSRGAMLLRQSGNPHVFAFSRIERGERTEYLVAANNSREFRQSVRLQTSQPPGRRFHLVFDSSSPESPGPTGLLVDRAGQADVGLAPLQLVVWKADAPLDTAPGPLGVHLAGVGQGRVLSLTARERDGQTLPSRLELVAETSGGDGFAEVTFALERASRPGQHELIGTADRPPFRVFWRPPADLAPGDILTFTATADDLRGHRSADTVGGVSVAPGSAPTGIRGATVPLILKQPERGYDVRTGSALAVDLVATGTAPLTYAWFHDGRLVPGAGGATLRIPAVNVADSGLYVATVHSREGTAISREFAVRVSPQP